MNNNKITISFTGHRPNKLYGYNYNNDGNLELMSEIYNKLTDIIKGYDEVHFIVGGALGIDQMAYIVCENLRLTYERTHKITIEVASPFEQQDCKWIESSRKLYRGQLENADKVTQVDELENYAIKEYEVGKYYPAKMQKRNEYMVDNSDLIVSVWNGTKGGTYNCLKYASKLNKKIINLHPTTFIWNEFDKNMLSKQ